jgi:hypothetical protein
MRDGNRFETIGCDTWPVESGSRADNAFDRCRSNEVAEVILLPRLMRGHASSKHFRCGDQQSAFHRLTLGGEKPG